MSSQISYMQLWIILWHKNKLNKLLQVIRRPKIEWSVDKPVVKGLKDKRDNKIAASADYETAE